LVERGTLTSNFVGVNAFASTVKLGASRLVGTVQTSGTGASVTCASSYNASFVALNGSCN
jgi:hypothetical protein